MTTRFVKVSALFAVVAMLLGLLVTACSEGDRDIAEPATDGATLYTTVGFGEATKALSKGFDCPDTTKYLHIRIVDKDGKDIVNKNYAREAEPPYVEAWKENGNDTVTTTTELSEDDLAAGLTTIFVIAVNDNGEPLGAYIDQPNFNQAVINADFTSQTAAPFISLDEMNVKLTVTNERNENGAVVVQKGDSVDIAATITCMYEDTLVVRINASRAINLETDPANKEYIELSREDENSPWAVEGLAEKTGMKVEASYENMQLQDTFDVDVVAAE